MGCLAETHRRIAQQQLLWIPRPGGDPQRNKEFGGGQRGAGAKEGQWEGTQEKEDEMKVRGPSQRM